MSKRSKRILAVICAVLLTSSLLAGLASAAEADAQPDKQQEIPLYIEGLRVGSGLKIADTTYVPFRVFVESLGQPVTVNWDDESETAVAEIPGLIITAQVGSKHIVANDRFFFAPGSVLKIDDVIYVPIRALASAFNIEVIWNEEFCTIDIGVSKLSPAVSGDEFYNSDDVYWLSRIINAESGNQPLEGKMGVGNVVLNRVADPTCPDSIYSVIFDNKYGVQFQVTTSNAIYAEPNAESVIAAKLCLEGYNTVENSLYFVNPQIGAGSWFANTRTYIATIGEHVFYA